ncbi:chemotaxis protein CheW [Nitrospirillum iridis]|uniref:Chemotaxis protein CheW n=1 Tax=Nitrospirillum iridis TaxID=765888 RepID=A0A7X0ECJ7_9PROT|nr:chemotaxis protein CheW [Nitrospirillum iridis]MBB6251190.1 purine-binding chemotaxis protein CheW [Nitrospirillum iridis]
MGRQKVLTFRIGATRLAAAAGDVTEVFRRMKVTRVPHAPSGLMGVTNVRGAVVPVVSLARLMGGQEAPVTAASRVLLLQAGEPVAVSVDEVGALVTLEADASGGPVAPGTLYADCDGATRLLDLAALLRRDFAGLAKGGGAGTGGRATPPAAVRAKDERAFLSFELAGQDYALPLAEVGEAITVPDHLATLPRTDEAMVGVVTLRGTLLPIVSLRVLLGLGRGGMDARARVIVAHIGNARVGLLVDRLNAILRVPATSVGAVPALLNRGRGEAQIGAICRLPDGRGLVSILSGERLFREDGMARILSDGRRAEEGDERSADMTDRHQDAAGERIVVFRLGDEEYGLPIDAVEEVVRLPDTLTRLPRAPAFIEGVMNLRGQVLPVIDQRGRFGIDGAGAARRRRVIVTRVNGTLAGFAVDAVSEILRLPADRVRETPGLAAADGAPLFDRIANLETADGVGRMILLIQPQALLDQAERDLLAALDDTLGGAEGAPGSAAP